MNDSGKNITVADLANEVGVSPATVSRVLNHSYLVNQSTYKKVMEAIDRLGYEIPEQRKSFVRKQVASSVFAVNVSNYCDEDYSEYLNGVQTSAYRYEWTPVLTQNPLSARTVDEYLTTIRRMQVAGLLLLNYVEKDVLEKIENEIPVVQCGEYNSESISPYVGIDDSAAAYTAVTHLISSGASRILFVNAPSRFRYARERHRGYEQALFNAGMVLNPSNIIELPEANYAMAHSFISPMLSFRNYPDAIFAANDIIAYAAVMAAREQGLSVPLDITVIGFGNSEISTMSMPKITTIGQPRFKMGFIGCELLHERWENQSAPTQNIKLATELIIRESTR